ncbi:INO80 complex subunit B [Phymastichus coffea]|uniref:INO80 complex subunit B n=1 Tax=Phymastichus coffea TaxID=108790 RepID=UPI00273CAE04|nr:INO80 complex subunit B [Phymastichus coffea]XP_058799070.1 INO80 complex subunit B [Phymastichus coffea]
MKQDSSDDDLLTDPSAIAVSQKKHKKHKHKKHKKKKIVQDGENYIGVSMDSDLKKTFKVRIRKEEDKSSDKVKEKIFKLTNLNMASTSTGLSPKTVKKKVVKTNRGKDSGTSSEEERWLDAIESGKLEEVDDELKKIKPKDPKLMTARQRAMFERKTDTEPNSGIEQLMSLPTGYKEKVMTAEAIQKAALKSLKRKQLADEKREKDKKKTMERLLKKQESKTSKVVTKGKVSKRQVPITTYKNNSEGSSLSLPLGELFPLIDKKGKEPPKVTICGVPLCSNTKKYSCSKTGIPLCSLECYKMNIAGIVS